MKFKEMAYLENVVISSNKKTHKEKILKVKVPFYCTYSELNRKKDRKLGEVHCTKIIPDDKPMFLYELVDESEQKEQEENNVVARNQDLAHLIENYKINIGKVKIIFMEE